MTPTQKLIAELSSPLNNPIILKNSQEREEEQSMIRIFDLVPRRKRSHRGRYSPDLSKVPTRKRTFYTYTTAPKWLLRVLSNMKIIDNPKRIITKSLDLNDVNTKQNRLSIPFLSLDSDDFLTFEEWKLLGEDNDGKMGVGGFLVDKRSKQWQVGLMKFVQRSDDSTETKMVKSYMLRGEWSDIVKDNGLREGDNITLWSFRGHGVLFFALDFADDSVNVSNK